VAPKGTASVNDKCQEKGKEVKQQTKVEKLDVGSDGRPNIPELKGVIDVDMPSRGVVNIPSGLAFNKAEIGFGWFHSSTSATSVGGRGMSSGPPTTLGTPVESPPTHCFGLGGIIGWSDLFPIWWASVATMAAIAFGFGTLPQPMSDLVAVVT
jgi:hypothetical protein